MDETPPTLRKRLQLKQAVIGGLEEELKELAEFTTCERQAMSIDKGITEMEKENNQLRKQVETTMCNVDSMLEMIQTKFDEKKKRFADLKCGVSQRSLESDEDGLSPLPNNMNLIDEVVLTFEEMSSFVREQRTNNASEGDNLYMHLDKMENSRLELQNSLDEVRRLSADFSLLKEPASSARDKEAKRVENLMDLSIPSFSQEGFITSEQAAEITAQELEMKLVEVGNQYQNLSTAYMQLQALIATKDSEIQSLTLKLADYEEAKEEKCDPDCAFPAESTNFNWSALPTIEETRESFDSIFAPSNEQSPCKQSDPGKPLAPSTTPAKPSLLNSILTEELDHCLSEIQNRDEHIALLYKTFEQLLASKQANAVDADAFVLAKGETVRFDESLIKADSCDSYVSLVGKLENVLNSIHKNVETVLSLPEFKLDSVPDSKTRPDSIDESFAVQEMCTVVINASVADVTLPGNPVGTRSHVEILKRVRNLKSSLIGILTNFNSDVLNVVNEVLRFENILKKINQTIFGEEASTEEISIYNDFCTNVLLRSHEGKNADDGSGDFEPNVPDNLADSINRATTPSGMGDSLHFSRLEHMEEQGAPASPKYDPGNLISPEEKHSTLQDESVTRSPHDESISHSQDAPGPRKSVAEDTMNATLHLSVLEDCFDAKSQSSELIASQFSPKVVTEELSESISAQKLSRLLNLLVSIKTKLGDIGFNGPNLNDEIVERSAFERIMLLAEHLLDELEESQIPHVREDKTKRGSLLKSPIKPLQDLSNSSEKENLSEYKRSIKNWKKLIHDSKIRTDEFERAKSLVAIDLCQKSLEVENLKVQLEDRNNSEYMLRNQLPSIYNNVNLLDHECKSLKEEFSLIANATLDCFNDLSSKMNSIASKFAPEESNFENGSDKSDELEDHAALASSRLSDATQKSKDVRNLLKESSEDYSKKMQNLQLDHSEFDSLFAELETARRSVMNCEEEITNLQNVVENLNWALSSKDATLRNLVGSIPRLYGRITSLGEDVKNVKASWSCVISDTNEQLNNVSSELSLILSKFVEAEEEKSILEVRLKEANNSITKLQQSNEAGRLSELQAHVLALTQDLEKAEFKLKESEALRTTVENLTLLNINLDSQLLEKSAHCAELGLKLESSSEQLLSSQQKIESLEAEVLRVTEDVEKAIARNSELEAVVLNLESTLSETRNNWITLINSSSACFDGLTKSKSEVNLELSRAKAEQSEIGMLKALISLKEEKIDALEDEIGELSRELKKIQNDEVASLQAELIAAEENLELLKSAEVKSAEVINELEARLLAATDAKSVFADRLQSVEDELADSFQTIGYLQSKLSTADAMLGEKNLRVEELETQKSITADNFSTLICSSQSEIAFRDLCINKLQFGVDELHSKLYQLHCNLCDFSNGQLSKRFPPSKTISEGIKFDEILSIIAELDASILKMAPLREPHREIPATQAASRSGSTTPMSYKSSAMDESTLDQYVRSTEMHGRHDASVFTQVELERSVFISDFQADRTLCTIDPLSMTLKPGDVLEAEYSSDEAEFATPVASKSQRGSPMNNITPKNIFSVEDSTRGVLEEKINSHQEEIRCLNNERDRISQILTVALSDFQENTPELSLDQKLTLLSSRISELAKAIEGSGYKSRKTGLTNAVQSLIEEYSRIASANEAILSSVKSESKKLRDDCESTKALVLKLSSASELNISHALTLLNELNSNQQLLVDQLAKRDSTIDNLYLEKATAGQKIAEITNAVETAESKLEETKEENAKLRCDLTTAQLSLEALKNEEESRKYLEQELLQLVTDWKGNYSSPSLLDGLKSIILEAQSMKKSTEDLKSSLASGLSMTKNIKNEFIKLRDFAAISKNDVDDSIAKASLIMHSLAKECGGQESLKEQISIMEERLEKCNGEIACFRRTIEENASTCESLQKTLKILEEENSVLRSENANLEKIVGESTCDSEEIGRLKAANEALSSDVSSFKQTVAELQDQLADCQSQLAQCKNDVNCGSCCSLKASLTKMISSTANKPIDLSRDHENPLDIISQMDGMGGILKKSNIIICDILQCLDLPEESGITALESIQGRLNDSRMKDALLCKQKISEEIRGLDSDVDEACLSTLSLVELHSKLVSVIMEKETNIINEYRANYEEKLANMGEELKHLAEKEKRATEYNETLLKENIHLESQISSMKISSPSTRVTEKTRRNSESKNADADVVKLLKDKVDQLEKQLDSLKLKSTNEIVELKGFPHRLADCLETFLDQIDSSAASLEVNLISSQMEDADVVERLHHLIEEIYKKFTLRQEMIRRLKKEQEETEEAVVKLNNRIADLTEEKISCSSASAAFEAALREKEIILESKENCITLMEKDTVSLRGEIDNLKLLLRSKEEEIDYLKKTKASDLGDRLDFHKKQVRSLIEHFPRISDTVAITKADALKFQSDCNASMSKTMSAINTAVVNFVQTEKTKIADGFKSELESLRNDVNQLHSDKNLLSIEKEKLEKLLENSETEKTTLANELKSFKQPVLAHDENNCPHREKLSEFKKEVYIARQRIEEEKKKFDVMKVNMEEELALKCSSIKELESRNDSTINDYKQRLSTLKLSYDQKCAELERSEATVSLLRDMNSQDKLRLEKDIDSLAKEIARLQMFKKLIEELNIEVSSDAVSAIKKKLSSLDEYAKEIEELKEKNSDLDNECEIMCKEIKFLEERNGAFFKECVEKGERLDKMEKEHSAKLQELKERLELEINTLKQSSAQSQAEFALALESMKEKLAEQQQNNSRLETACSHIENSLQSCNKKILVYANQIAELERGIAEKEKKIEEMMVSLEEQQGALVSQKSAETRSRHEIENLKELLQQRTEEMESARREWEKALESKAMLTQRVRALEVEVGEGSGSMKETISQLEKRNEELEALLVQSSQVERIERYKLKIASLEREIQSLKQQVQSNIGHYSSPRRVDVKPSSSADGFRTVAECERAMHELDKKYGLIKKLAHLRYEKIIKYESLLRSHNINYSTNDGPS